MKAQALKGTPAVLNPAANQPAMQWSKCAFPSSLLKFLSGLQLPRSQCLSAIICAPSTRPGCSLLEYLNELQIQTHVNQVLEEAKTNSEWLHPEGCFGLRSCCTAADCTDERQAALQLHALPCVLRCGRCLALYDEQLSRLQPVPITARGVPKREQTPALDPFGNGLEAESNCSVCKRARMTFEPPSLYCYGCGQRIKRNQVGSCQKRTWNHGNDDVQTPARLFECFPACYAHWLAAILLPCQLWLPAPNLTCRCIMARPPAMRSRGCGATPATARSRRRLCRWTASTSARRSWRSARTTTRSVRLRAGPQRCAGPAAVCLGHPAAVCLGHQLELHQQGVRAQGLCNRSKDL